MRTEFAAICVVLGLWAPAAEAQTRAPERLQAMGEVLQSRSAWRADYGQTYVPAGMSLGEETGGAVWVAWPDRALFLEAEPPIRSMGMEGRTVRLVDLTVPSCEDHVLGDEEWARIPLAAVLDPQAAVDRFTLTDGEDGRVVLIPREPSGIARVELALDPQGLPADVWVEDPQGAVNHLSFSGWTAVEGPPGGVWLPEAPEGLECASSGLP